MVVRNFFWLSLDHRCWGRLTLGDRFVIVDIEFHLLFQTMLWGWVEAGCLLDQVNICNLREFGCFIHIDLVSSPERHENI